MSEDPRPKHPFVPVMGMQSTLRDSERYGTGRKVIVHIDKEHGLKAEFESCGVSTTIRLSPEAFLTAVALLERKAPGFLDIAKEWSKKPLTPLPPTA